jgi:hypothetical protein
LPSRRAIFKKKHFTYSIIDYELKFHRHLLDCNV